MGNMCCSRQFSIEVIKDEEKNREEKYDFSNITNLGKFKT